MSDCVIDATVIAFSNGDIAARKPGNVFDRRLSILEQVARGTHTLRYNAKLRTEYEALTNIVPYRNDVIELFFAALTDRGVLVRRSTLSRQHYSTAKTCKWPTHDQHLLAAAVGGTNPYLFVTEQRHGSCGDCILRQLHIRVERLA